LKILSNGEGTAAAHGAIEGGRLLPATYSSRVTMDDKVDEVRLALTAGVITEAVAEPPTPPSADRVPISDAHRRGVLDPMTAELMLVGGSGDPVSPEACRRTLPIFDGRQRFDLTLTFKRFDHVKAEKGYQGPVVVCMVSYQPVAGHRPGRAAIKYLMATRDMEMWLAPIAGTRVLVPFRASVALTGELRQPQDRLDGAANPGDGECDPFSRLINPILLSARLDIQETSWCGT